MTDGRGRQRIFARELYFGDDGDGRRTDRFLDRKTPGNVGVALSGGGSRACVAALGQLRALRALGHLGRVRAISSVSGGTWLSAAWTFLPDELSDEGFFGPLIARPEALICRATCDGDREAAIDTVPEACFAHAITSTDFDPAGILALGHRAAQMGVPSDRRWASVIGEVLLRPQGLHHIDERGRAAAFFAADEAAVASARRANPGVLPARALTVHRSASDATRPFAIFNTALRVFDPTGEPGAAPVQATPWFIGTVSTPDAVDRRGRAVGGGALPPFAYGGRLVGASDETPRLVEVERDDLFGLHDIVGASSAFYADKAVEGRLSEPLVPEYERFRPGAAVPSGGPDHYLDGGALENTGVAALLAYADIERLVIFVNAPAPLLLAEDGSGLPVLERQVPPLFGYRPYEDGVGYRPYESVDAPVLGSTGARPRRPLLPPRESSITHSFRRNAVFHAGDFPALLSGLLDRSAAGTGAPGVGPAAFLQRGLRVIDNPWFGVRGGRSVDALWSLLSPASSWVERLSPQVRRGGLPMWPNYPTALTRLPPQMVNLLAHFTAWTVLQLRPELDALFRDA